MSIWEQLFTSLMRVFIEFITIVLIVSAMLFLYNVNTVNNYISQCNAIVARSGGLTRSAYNKCEMYSRDYYHGYFHASASQHQQYKDTKADMKIEYKVNGANKYVTVPYDSDSIKNHKYNGYRVISTSFVDSAENYQSHEQAFGQPTTYYIYSKVPFMRTLPDLPKLYYGTHDKPDPAHNYNWTHSDSTFHRPDISKNNNGGYKNAGNSSDDSQEAQPIEEDVHSMIRAGSQN